MSETLAELEELISLAKEPSSTKRRVLLRNITDVFVQGANNLSDRQSVEFGEIMHQLSQNLEVQVRSELANKLAAIDRAPRNVIQALANDEIDIARPVLEKSNVLTEDDLIKVCQHHSQEHLRAIINRTSISSNLSGVLVEKGDDTTVKNLLLNDAAELTEEIQIRISVRARKAKLLQEPLIDRQDVTKDILVDLYASVAGNLKDKILEAYEKIDSKNIGPVIKNVAEKLGTARAYSIEDFVEELFRTGRLTESQLLEFVSEKKLMEFLVGFAKFMGIEVSTARTVIGDATGKTLIVVCKSKNLSPSTFKAIAVSPITAISGDLSELLPLVSIYRRFDTKNAQRVMRFWSTRKHLDKQTKEADNCDGTAEAMESRAKSALNS